MSEQSRSNRLQLFAKVCFTQSGLIASRVRPVATGPPVLKPEILKLKG